MTHRTMSERSYHGATSRSVYVLAYVCVSMYIHTRACMHEHTHTRMHEFTLACMIASHMEWSAHFEGLVTPLKRLLCIVLNIVLLLSDIADGNLKSTLTLVANIRKKYDVSQLYHCTFNNALYARVYSTVLNTWIA